MENVPTDAKKKSRGKRGDLDVSRLRADIFSILQNCDLSAMTGRSVRAALERRMGLTEGGLKKHKKAVSKVMKEVLTEMQRRHKKQQMAERKSKPAADGSVADEGMHRKPAVTSRVSERSTQSAITTKKMPKAPTRKRKSQLGEMDDDSFSAELSEPMPVRSKRMQRPKARVKKAKASGRHSGSGQKAGDLLAVPSEMGDEWAVHCDASTGKPLAAMLNQTDIGYGVRGHNKFYAIVLLTHRRDSIFLLRCHWGRVGHKGQQSEVEFDNARIAEKQFANKFRSKTKNVWASVLRGTFTAVKGKYSMVDMSTANDDEDSDDAFSEEDLDAVAQKDTGIGPAKAQPLKCSLDKRVIQMMQMIFSRRMLQNTMRDLNIDMERCPLGKLSKRQILKGYSILAKIQDELDAASIDHGAVIELSNQFYTNVPHDFGFALPPPIGSTQLVARKLELLATLSDVELTQRILSRKKRGGVAKHPIDLHFDALRCGIEPMEASVREFQVIGDAIANTHASTHSSYSLEVVHMFECERKGAALRHAPFAHMLEDKRLLWHGSRLSNMVGILSQGLRIAPTEAPVTGYMFGKGVYLSDCASKAANYCHASHSQPYGLLLLCKAALGNALPLTKPKYIQRPPAPFHSVFGRGKCDTRKPQSLNGYLLNCELQPGGGQLSSDLLYNEYIVYDVCQVKIQYIVLVKFNFI